LSDAFQPSTDIQSTEQARENVRSLIEFNQRYTKAEFASDSTGAVESVGIVGAGMMGAAIAAATVEHGLRVVVNDVSEAALSRLPGDVAATLAANHGHAMPPAEAEWTGLIELTTDLEAIARCDLVVETVVERFFVKQPLFAELEPKTSDTTVLTSNTSTIAITRLASHLAVPQRFCGVHFLRPVHRRPIIEIIRGPETSQSTIATAVAYVNAIHKIPLVLNDAPGFVVNRLLLPYVGEAMELLLEGVSMDAIERTATEFGMAMGPLALLDEIGMDTALDCGLVFASAYPDNVISAPLLVPMIKARHLGRKTRSGFFTYDDDSEGAATKPNPATGEIIAKWIKTPREHTSESIAARLFLPMLLEATRILQEEVVSDPHLVDLAVIHGLGFPQSRGGLLYWADELGAANVAQMLQSLDYLGKRARPTPLLREVAETDGRFYAGPG